MKLSIIGISGALVLAGSTTAFNAERISPNRNMQQERNASSTMNPQLELLMRNVGGEPEEWGACCASWGCYYILAEDAELQCMSNGGGTYYSGVLCEDTPCDLWGACCLNDGTCTLVDIESECWNKGGTNFFVGQHCSEIECSEPLIWGCCFGEDICKNLTWSDCITSGGYVNENYEICEEAICYRDCDKIVMFSNIALPLTLESCGISSISFGSIGMSQNIDVDGDGIEELSKDIASAFTGGGLFGNYMVMGSVFNESTTIGTITVTNILDVSTDVIDYSGIPDDGYSGPFQISCEGYMDVTLDGKKDAIIEFRRMGGPWNGGDYSFEAYFYIENISEWPAACATDINNDGSTNVNDLLAVVGNWGACP
jgi:hypothetical protein